MKKLNSNPIVYLLFIIICSMVFVSCNEDKIVTSPEEPYKFDSARYGWNIETLNKDFLTFHAFDTSNVFFLDFRNLTYYNGSDFVTYDFGDHFIAISMGCFDMNNIYLGGSNNSVGNNSDKPQLKKWNGNSFDEIPIKDSTNRKYQISTILAKAQNEIWMGSTRGDLIHYDNGNFEFLRIDSTFIFLDFGTNETGNNYAVASKTVFDTSSTTTYLKIYEKNISVWNWSEVFSEIYYNYDVNEILPSKLVNVISGFQRNHIVKFTGNSFVKIFEIEPFIPYTQQQLSDSNLNSFMLPGTFDNSGLKLFGWNGNKWSLEISFNDIGLYSFDFRKIQNVNTKYYFLYKDTFLPISYFGIGKKISHDN